MREGGTSGRRVSREEGEGVGEVAARDAGEAGVGTRVGLAEAEGEEGEEMMQGGTEVEEEEGEDEVATGTTAIDDPSQPCRRPSRARQDSPPNPRSTSFPPSPTLLMTLVVEAV